MTSSGCRRSALPITFGTTMCPSIWWMTRKRIITQISEIGWTTTRVDRRRDRAEPGPEVRDQLRHGDPRAEQERVLVRSRDQPGHPEHPHSHSGARPDDQRDQHLALHVADDRVLHPHEQRLRPGMGWEPSIERRARTWRGRAACRSRRRARRSRRRAASRSRAPLPRRSSRPGSCTCRRPCSGSASPSGARAPGPGSIAARACSATAGAGRRRGRRPSGRLVHGRP